MTVTNPDIKVELLLGGVWTDVSDRAYLRAGAQVERGRRDAASATSPGRCVLHLRNVDGALSPRNPYSPYYGLLGRNTPMRLWVRAGSPHLLSPSDPRFPSATAVGGQAVVAAGPGIDLTAADLDFAVDVALDRIPAVNAQGVGETTELAGRYRTAGDQRQWRFLLQAQGYPHLGWSPNGVDLLLLGSTAPLPYYSGQRCALRVQLDVDNGAGGHTAHFWTAPTIAGPWARLGEPAVGAGTTSIKASSTSPLEIGNISLLGFLPGYGRYYAAQLRDGIDGPLLADADFTAQTPGTSTWTDSVGRTWTLGIDGEITDYYLRFHGEVSTWPTQWHPTGMDQWSAIEAAGPLRRLGQGQKALPSTLRRRIPSAASLLAYWPLEDGAGATAGYSPIEGVRPLRVGGFDFAAASDLAGSAPLPTIAGGAFMRARVPSGTPGSWRVEMVYRLPQLPSGGDQTMLEVLTTGTWPQLRVSIASNAVRVHGMDSSEGGAATTTLINVTNPAFAGEWGRLRLTAEDQGGGQVQIRVGWVVIGDVGLVASTTITGQAGRVTNIDTTFGSELEGMAVGHLVALADADANPLDDADTAFAGERALARVRRLAEEEAGRVQLLTPGLTGISERVGPQRPDTLLGLLEDVAAADGGVLTELRTWPTLQYLPRAVLYNRPPALTIDAQGQLSQPLEPLDDDLEVRNDVTVVREGGASARAVAETGPLSVGEVGLYDESRTLNLATDDQTEPHAWWRLHLGTVDAARYPSVRLSLHAPRTSPLMQDILDRVDVQSVIVVTNPPPGLPPDEIRLVVEGYTERMHAGGWDVEFQCSPASPWTVAGVVPADGVAGPEAPMRVDTDGSVLAAAVDADDEVLLVHTPRGAGAGMVPVWVTSAGPGAAGAGDVPWDVRVGGEVVRVGACQPAEWDLFTRSVSGGWGTASDGQVWTPVGTAADFAVNGTAGTITLSSPATTVRRQQRATVIGDCEVLVRIAVSQVATGASIVPGIMLRQAGADFYRARLHFGTSGAMFVSVAAGSTTVGAQPSIPFTYTAGSVWWLRARIVGQVVSVRAWPDGTGEPVSGWQHSVEITTPVVAAGAVGVTASALTGNTNTNAVVGFDDFQVVTPQRMTVQRSINGVVKAHQPGADVRLAQAPIVAL